MSETVKIILAQQDYFVGDVAGNANRIVDTAQRARDEFGADVVAFPELALCGYPPEDLLFHRGLQLKVAEALDYITKNLYGISAVFGFPEYDDDVIYNSAALINDGKVDRIYRKQCLPNYAVFDEERYFKPGDEPCVFDINGIRIAVTICEDIWLPGPSRQAKEAGADLILSINGSPYEIDSQRLREKVMRDRVADSGLPLVYVNQIGGQDELVFDGGSTVMDASGNITQRAVAFEETLLEVTIVRENGVATPESGKITEPLPDVESVYMAVVTGARDYVNKNGFSGVIIGLSGGVDSALTLSIAVDALGADRVRAVMMPSQFTSEMSLEDARLQANACGIQYDVLSIENMFEASLETLEPMFADLPKDTTEENIQARCRGILLMAISNKTGRMLLTTGNKSEMAVGYATLYGDMAGGFAPIKDCSKTLVYELARFRNGVSPVIPERVLTREPSAELAPDQKDSDSLPPYDVLDPILEAFIEDDLSVDQIADLGFDRQVVGRVLELVKRNEYKRRQATPGVRISRRAFGRDWRYPITSGYRSD